MLSAFARKVVTYNKVKSALLSYEDVVDKLIRITDHCDIARDPSDPIVHYYKIFIQQYLNNVGDPLSSSQLHLHSKGFEAEVIKHFASLYNLEEDNIGGYIEWDFPRSELFIMNVIITRFSRSAIFFIRREVNSRVLSLIKLFHIPSNQIKLIDSETEKGGMDLKKLSEEIAAMDECQPIVIWLSLGDVNGSVDNLNDVQSILRDRKNVHIHYSCSSLGVMMPYMNNNFGINFENGLDSISFPLCDFFGIPISGGISLTKKTLSNLCSLEIAVIKEKDSTIPGSRIGHIQILLWIALKSRGNDGINEEIKRVQKNCLYLKETLELNGTTIKTDPFMSSIFLETHSKSLIENWKLNKIIGSKNCYKLEILPHMTRAKLDLFMEQFKGAAPKIKIRAPEAIPDEFPKLYLLSELDYLRLDNFDQFLTDFKRTFVGYPINIEFSDKHLKDILKIFEYNITSKAVQGLKDDMLRYMSDILRIPLDELYAVVTSGGSFSNLLGSLVPLSYFDNPVLYVSHDAHYSIIKYTKILNLDYVIVKSQDTGELDYEDLEKQIAVNMPRPVIIILNIGSTVKGAIDSIKTTKEVIKKLKLTRVHIHCDAALDGGFLPLINSTPQHGFDLGIDSLAISVHKYLGVPIPCSIFMTRKNLMMNETAQIIDDIFSVKDGIITALIWYAINRHRTITPGKEARQQLEKADYLFEKMNKISYPVWKNVYSNIVYFKKPSDATIARWKLASVDDLSHIVLMHHVNYELIDEFFEDIRKQLN